MDVVLIVLGVLCLIVGFVGSIVPAIPGVPIAYASLWLLHATDKVQLTWQVLLIWGIVTLVAVVLDYYVPAWGAKKFGGSKWGNWGSIIGLIIGMIVGGWWGIFGSLLGIIVGPFVGAVVGELIAGKRSKEAVRAGLGTFIGFLVGTALKLVCCGLITWQFIYSLI